MSTAKENFTTIFYEGKRMTQLLYACFLSVWRRCFGSNGWDIPIIKHRVVQHIIGALACFGICLYNDYHWIQGILCSAVLQGLYWARAHGEFFDYGHSNPVNVARYEKEWWWKFVKKIMPKSVYYSFTCDFICMTVRYTLPAILCGLVLFNIPVMFMGLALACVYALMWKFHDWYGIKNPTEISEWIVGFITGLFIGG